MGEVYKAREGPSLATIFNVLPFSTLEKADELHSVASCSHCRTALGSSIEHVFGGIPLV